jgi:hypothetical protein
LALPYAGSAASSFGDAHGIVIVVAGPRGHATELAELAGLGSESYTSRRRAWHAGRMSMPGEEDDLIGLDLLVLVQESGEGCKAALD